MKSNSKKLIHIIGNIGVGKSTIIDYLRKIFTNEFNFIDEPAKFWVNSGLLKWFYDDMKNRGMMFQSNVLISRSFMIDLFAKNEKDVICDGGIAIDRFVFCEVLQEEYKNKNGDDGINEKDRNSYISLYNEFYSRLSSKYDIQYIYLKCSPETCRERITKRNRGEETGITLKYLSDLHDHLEKFAKKEKAIMIDAEQNEEKVAMIVKEKVDKIMK